MIQLRIGFVTVSDLFFLVSFIATLLKSQQIGNFRRVQLTWIFLNLLIGLILSLQTLYYSMEKNSSLLGVGKLVFATMVVFYLVVHQTLNFPRENQLVRYFSAGSALAAISAQFNFGSPEVSAGGLIRAGGLAGHPVGLAISSGTAIALMLQIHARVKGKTELLRDSVIIFLNAFGLYISVGGTGFVIALSGILVGFLFSSQRIVHKILSFVLLSISGFLLFGFGFGNSITNRIQGAFFPSHGLSTSSGELNGSTVEIRLFTWEHGIKRILQHPLLGNGFDESGQFAYGRVATHNYFLLMWQSGGLLAFLISLSLLFSSVGCLITLWKNRFIFSASQVGAVAIVTTFVGALTSPALYGRQLYFTVAIGIGLGIRSNRQIRFK
jgi:hypothetical protein